MALPNLSGSNIQDTFQRVLHTDGAEYFDGTGSVVPIVLANTSPSFVSITASADISASRWIRGQQINIDAGATFGSAKVLGNLSVNGDIIEAPGQHLRIASPLTASSEISSSSTISASAFVGAGNITGQDLIALGDISASGTIIGSNLSGTNTGDQDLSSYSTIVQLNASGSTLQTNIDAKAPIASPSFTGNITASGNISASSTMSADTIVMGHGGKFYLDGPVTGLSNTYIQNPGGGDKIEFYIASSQKFQVGQTGTLFNNNTVTILGNLTSSGHISSSGTITATSFVGNMDGGTF